MRAIAEFQSRDDWSNVVALYKRGSFSACLQKLENVGTAKSRSLQARTLIRLDRNIEALEAISKENRSNDDDTDDVGENEIRSHRSR